tara:strand:- start:229 stop:741 length:513 start_codon:yes stop_codon:yes gene_type:complete
MELTYKHTEIYDWVGDEELRTSIMKGIDEIEYSNALLKKCNYEPEMSKILGWESVLGRYKDAELPDGTDVEVKKSSSTSFILDAVRYAEMYYGACDNGIHLFINFKSGKIHQINRIMIVPNWMVVRMMIPNQDMADSALTMYNKRKEMDQGLNCQALLNVTRMIDKFNNM